MKLLRTHVVSLYKEAAPLVPPECVACGAPEPTSRIAVSDRAMVWSSMFFFWMYWAGRKDRAAFLACRACAIRDRLVWFGRIAMFCALAWWAMSYAYPYFKEQDWPRILTKFATAGTVIAALAPAILWTQVFPRPVTLDVQKDHTNYEFARKDYADSFRAMNTTMR